MIEACQRLERVPRKGQQGTRLKSFRCIRRLSLSVIFWPLSHGKSLEYLAVSQEKRVNYIVKIIIIKRCLPRRCLCFCSMRLDTSGAVAADIALLWEYWE